MDQVSLFSSSVEQQVYTTMYSLFHSACAENGCKDHFSLVENKSYYSIQLFSSVFLRIHQGRKPYFSVPVDCVSSNISHTDSGGWAKFYLDDLSHITRYEEIIRSAIQKAFDDVPTDFDCCSRYEQCSDALRCIHPDLSFSFGCRYKRNLKKGRVFYGSNRTE